MPNDPLAPDPGAVPERLALRPREAAAALGIGERLLWRMTRDGEIPHVRLGRAVVYPVDELRRWLIQSSRGIIGTDAGEPEGGGR